MKPGLLDNAPSKGSALAPTSPRAKLPRASVSVGCTRAPPAPAPPVAEAHAAEDVADVGRAQRRIREAAVGRAVAAIRLVHAAGPPRDRGAWAGGGGRGWRSPALGGIRRTGAGSAGRTTPPPPGRLPPGWQSLCNPDRVRVSLRRFSFGRLWLENETKSFGSVMQARSCTLPRPWGPAARGARAPGSSPPMDSTATQPASVQRSP
jgi:hypothetical protein